MNSNNESATLKRYSEAAQDREEALCCAVSYDPKYLKVLPPEILDRDYGCGDPTAYVREGDSVLDLGSGAGKVCFIASQIVGPRGRVIGVDFNDDMLSLARKHAPAIAKSIGWQNVDFQKSHIQDLEHLIPDQSMDVILSNCVLNLVTTDQKEKLFSEIFRVLKKDGRAAISDIVSNQEVPGVMRQDPELWSGCISGALEERAFMGSFLKAGFSGIRIEKRDDKPWKVVQGIEFRSVTVLATKGISVHSSKPGSCC